MRSLSSSDANERVFGESLGHRLWILRVHCHCLHLWFSIRTSQRPMTILVCLGFNNFMEDIRMMLGRRPFEPYWFFTWCISGPIITLVSTSKAFSLEAPLFVDRFLLVDHWIPCTHRRWLYLSSLCQCSRLVDDGLLGDLHSRDDDLRIHQSLESDSVASLSGRTESNPLH